MYSFSREVFKKNPPDEFYSPCHMIFFLFYLERDYNKLDPNKVILKVVTLSGFGLVSHPFWFLSQSRARIEPNLPLRDLWVVDLAPNYF